MAKMTLEMLWSSAMRLSPWRRNYSQSPKRQITNMVPFVGTKTVLITASFWGLTSKSVHLTNILVHNCEIFEEQAQPTASHLPQQPAQPTQPTQPNQYKPVGTTPRPTQPYGGVNLPYDSATHFKVSYQGKNYWIKKFDLRRQSVSVRCSCEDYYFCFSYSNYVGGVQFGGMARPYYRVPGSTRPPKNPNRIQGLCKHLAQMTQILNTYGYTQ